MSRIANYASQQILNSYLQKVQQRLNTTQVQLTSEKKAQDYMGIGYDTQRLVGYEVNVSLLNGYKRNNDIEDIYLKSTEVAMTGVESTIRDFRTTLTSFNTLAVKDEDAIRTIQQQAFRSMQSLQSYLNTPVNGRYLFGGNRINEPPVDLALGTMESFQSKFDGVNMSYASSRDMHLENFAINKDSTDKPNWLTFAQDSDGSAATAGTSTITANTAQFSNVTVGSTIEVTGTANNNGTYEVSAVTGGGTTIEINTKMLTDSTTTAVMTANDGTVVNENVTFNRAAGTIVGAAGTLSALTTGSSFVVSGTAQNDGTYIVESNNGTTLNIKEAKLVDEGTTASTVSSLTAQDFTFSNTPETVTAAAGTPFSAAVAGMKVTFGGTGSNNATYTIASVVGGGSSITVLETVTAEAAAGANDTALITTATPTLDIVAQSFNYTSNATGFDTIASPVAGTFSALSSGMSITTAGAFNAANNKTYTIASVSSDGKTLTVREDVVTEVDGANNDSAVVTQADGTVKSVGYYQGDNFTRTHRVAENREFIMDLSAADPAFEKAIRAMGLIAQGKFGTAGGLEQDANEHRMRDALNLIDLSLKGNSSTNPQYEIGFTNNIEQSFVTLGYQRSLIQDANATHTRLAGFFESRVADLENIDKLDAITRLLDDQKSLEASYQAMATVRSLSLHNYLR